DFSSKDEIGFPDRVVSCLSTENSVSSEILNLMTSPETAMRDGYNFPSEIAFIDPNVDDLPTLLGGIRSDIEPIVLADDEPALRQMARAVAARKDLEAIHVIAHGRPGEVCFAAGTLSIETIDHHQADLAKIGRALGGRKLLLWSCETGQ